MNASTENNAYEPKKYYSRYGLMTAQDTAIHMLDRSGEKLKFLEAIFEAVSQGGEGFTMPGFCSEGLAAIMDDIAIDVSAVHDYLYGDDPTPGKEFEGPEVRHD